MKRILAFLVLLIGLTALSSPSHAQGNSQYIVVTVDLDYDTGWWDDTIFSRDPNSVSQTKCPRLAFWPSYGLQYNTWPTSQNIVPAPGQDPNSGYKITTHCIYRTGWYMPPGMSYSFDVFPLCAGTANILLTSMAHFTGVAGNSFSGTQYFNATVYGPFRNKSFWQNVIGHCGGSTTYYTSHNSITFTYNGNTYYSLWQ